MRALAWIVAVVDVIVLAASCMASVAAMVAWPCTLVGLAAYSYLAFVDHREHR
jgi:hypothetical protein